MRALTILALVAAFTVVDWCLQPAPVLGQSLAEIAAREKERRKGKTEKVITEDELKRAGRPEPPPADATATTGEGQAQGPAAATGAQKGEKTDEELRAEREKDWNDRHKKAQDEVSRLTARIAELQTTTGDLRVLQTGPHRVQAMAELEAARQELQQAQQRLEDMEEERRREGFTPPAE
jgi:hypothetical protein